MQDEKIRRINELAKKSRVVGLTPAEVEEQQRLRAEYVAAFLASLKAQLDNTVIVDADGNRMRPKQKPPVS